MADEIIEEIEATVISDQWDKYPRRHSPAAPSCSKMNEKSLPTVYETAVLPSPTTTATAINLPERPGKEHLDSACDTAFQSFRRVPVSVPGVISRGHCPSTSRNANTRHGSIPAMRHRNAASPVTPSSVKDTVARRFSAFPEARQRSRIFSIFYKDHYRIVAMDLHKRLREIHDMVARYHVNTLALPPNPAASAPLQMLHTIRADFMASMRAYAIDILPELRCRDCKDLTQMAVEFSALLTFFALETRKCLSILDQAELMAVLASLEDNPPLLSPDASLGEQQNLICSTTDVPPDFAPSASSLIRKDLEEVESHLQNIENAIVVYFSPSSTDTIPIPVIAIKKKRKDRYCSFLPPVMCCGRKQLYA